MKKLIILILTISIYTSLSQSWEKVSYFANFYNDFLESENYVFSQNASGIKFTPKNEINFNNSRTIFYPDSPNGIAISKYSVFNDSTLLVVLGITSDTTTKYAYRLFKSKPNMNEWEDMGIDLTEDIKEVDRFIMIDDTTFIGTKLQNNLNYFYGKVFIYTFENNLWLKKLAYEGNSQNQGKFKSLNYNKKINSLIVKDYGGYIYKINVNSLRKDTLDYNLFYIDDLFYEAIHSFSTNDTSYFFCDYYWDSTSTYLLKLVNENEISIVSKIPFKYEIFKNYYTYLYNNGKFVVLDHVKNRIACSIDYGSTWKYDIIPPQDIFTKDNIYLTSSLLTSNGYLFVNQHSSLKAYYNKLKDPTSVEEELPIENHFQSTHIELYDILGRNIATYPSYEKLKAEIENYPPPHLIKWRDEKGIYHFEKMK